MDDRVMSGRVVRVNLTTLFKAMFTHGSTHNYFVSEGVPEDAKVLSAFIDEDSGVLMVEFDREVPDTIKCRVFTNNINPN